MQTQTDTLAHWPDLKCFQHCDRNSNILCFTVPTTCPVCQCDTSITSSRIPPYVLPSPFVASGQAPCSIVLRPTTGDFIGNYTSIADLHIGVTDSSGGCYDFDESGLHIGSAWPQCVALRSISKGILPSFWDQTLHAFANPREWTRHRYHEANCNCFDFVLDFLHVAGLRGRWNDSAVSDKQTFCEEFMLQQTSRAARFVSLYHRVLQEGYVIDIVKS